MEPYIRTYSGVLFTPFKPVIGDIRIEDIAHALSYLPRFGGHTSRFYSVAQHSLYVAQRVPCREALLHDAAEAYLGDVPRLLKHSPWYAAYRKAERRLEEAIATRFELGSIGDPAIKAADNTALIAEIFELMDPTSPAWDHLRPFPTTIMPIDPWPREPPWVERRFMEAYRCLPVCSRSQ